ncbi:hypothetical protein B0E53_06733 [Micromonospora sp. MH33]|nr:hypothetical protein B0E53_06733 [Micromonospora sp. MH33]
MPYDRSRAYPSAEYACAGPRSASASTRVASSSASTVISGPSSPVTSRRVRAMARARRCRATRSRGPIRQRAPVSSRSSAAPSVGSASTRSVQTTSRTSGVSSSPPSPTTSTGSPRARSAASIAGIWLRSRTRTAVVGRRCAGMCSGSESGIPAAPRQAASTLSAIQSASSAYVSSSAQCTVPAARPPGLRCGIGSRTLSAARSSGTRAPAARSGTDSALATPRISGRLRQLVVRLSTSAGAPSVRANSVGNRSSVPALAPRQP